MGSGIIMGAYGNNTRGVCCLAVQRLLLPRCSAVRRMFDFSPEQILSFLTRFPIVLISVAIHEFAHCWADDRLGDDTSRREGRLTLNPLAHLDPLGTLMMVVSSFSGMGFGWGKDAHFNPANFKNPARDRMLGALAGPVSNIIQAIIWYSLLILLSMAPPIVANICWTGVVVNIVLAAFNLLPIYPLDGHHVLGYFLPRNLRAIIDNPAWMYVFLAFMFITPLRTHILHPVLAKITSAVVAVLSYVVS